VLPFLGPYVDESHMWKRRFPYEEYNKWTVTGNQDSKLIVTALKAGALDFAVKGAQSEFSTGNAAASGSGRDRTAAEKRAGRSVEQAVETVTVTFADRAPERRASPVRSRRLTPSGTFLSQLIKQTPPCVPIFGEWRGTGVGAPCCAGKRS
jgi:hypothetical protein